MQSIRSDSIKNEMKESSLLASAKNRCAKQYDMCIKVFNLNKLYPDLTLLKGARREMEDFNKSNEDVLESWM